MSHYTQIYLKIPHPMLKLQIEMTHTLQKEEETGQENYKGQKQNQKMKGVRDDPLLNSGKSLH